MRGKFFKTIFYLLILISISACNQVTDLFNTIDYIGTVKKIEINSPDLYSKDMITIEDLVHGFLKANYNEVSKDDIKWEKLGNLDNGQLLQASYKEASVKIRAMKNGDFVQVRPIEIEFKSKDGNRYSFFDVPFSKPTNETTKAISSNTITQNTDYNTSPTSNENYSNNSSNYTNQVANEYDEYDKYRKKFGRVVNDKYVGGSLIEFIKNADPEEYFYLRDQFWQIADTMYVTEDKKTYYYLYDIIDKLEEKADTNMPRVHFLEVKGKKLYYTVGFPKDYNANTPSWVQFEIFEREFKDGLALRTAHVSCAINGVEYKDWEAVYAIFE